MKKTIAFNHSSNEWVSRYSYTSSCIGWIKDHMITAPTSTQSSSLFWKHDGNGSSNCSFYGANAVPPGVSFSFNTNPSANKIYKSFSIESPDFTTSDFANSGFGLNVFRVNNGTPNALKDSAMVHKIKEYGGLLYGGVKGTVERKQNVRVHPLGVIESLIGAQDFSNTYSNVDSSSLGSNFAFMKISGGPAYMSLSSGTSVVKDEEIESALSTSGGTISSKVYVEAPYEGGFIVRSYNPNLTPLDWMSAGDVVSIVYDGWNGSVSDQPKGQFADVAVIFDPNRDFEIHAFNVDFEMTDLDHNS